MALLYHIAHYLSSDFVRLTQINIEGGRRSDYQRAGKRGRERSLHYSSGGFGILAGETAAICEGIVDRRRVWGWCGKWGRGGGTTCADRCKIRRRKYGNRPPMRQSGILSLRAATCMPCHARLALLALPCLACPAMRADMRGSANQWHEVQLRYNGVMESVLCISTFTFS